MIVLNELEYAEKCISENIVEKKPFSTLNILAKYYYHHLGKDEKEIIDILKDFAKKNCTGYSKNKYVWDNNIAKMVEVAIQYPLHQIKGVWITSKELTTIRNIHNKALERLAFTILCLAKYNIMKNPKSDGWINNDIKEIFSLARISAGINERGIKLHELYKLGLIDLAKKIDNLSIKVCFVDNDKSGNELFISDFRELGYEYLLYRGENFIRCGECGILVRGNKAGTKHYCSSCIAYSPIETKKLICIDCGDEFTVDARNAHKDRCSNCYEVHRAKRKLETQRIRRNNAKMKSEVF